MQIVVKGAYHIYTEVPDDMNYKEKGLRGPMQFQVYILNTPHLVAHFGFEPMPGCCGVVVSTNSFVETGWRNTPIGPLFHELKAEVAKYFGYKVMIMTTQLRNMPEVVGAAKKGWRFLHYFRNKRTDNDIGIAVKDLP